MCHVQRGVLPQVQAVLLERAVHGPQLKHQSLLLLHLHTTAPGLMSYGISSSGHAGWRPSLTSACFSFSVACSSDTLSLSLSLSVRSLKPSSSDTLSCASMCDSRSNKTLFCTDEKMKQNENKLPKETAIDYRAVVQSTSQSFCSSSECCWL